MKIHEYQAKALLEAVGAPIPKAIVARSAQEALDAFDALGGNAVVIKAQVHAGGRGKGSFIGAPVKWGGVKYVAKREDVLEVAGIMLKYHLVTKQTTSEGQPVSTLLVQVAADIEREVYLGMVLDRTYGLPVMMACADGGVDIEEVAAHNPEKILKIPVVPELGLPPFQAQKLAFELGFTGEQVGKAANIMLALSEVFMENDCSLAEINPLIVTKQGDVVVLDAKFDFDDNAMFRHPKIAEMRDLSEENVAEIRAGKANLNFIQLSGNIGCLVNGAGLAMATMDIIHYYGGEPANFLDVGGGVTPEGAIEAFRIILGDTKVKGILVNIFGGIARCDLIADALVKAGREIGFKIPVVVRLEGTRVEEGRKVLESVRGEMPMIRVATGLTEAAKTIVELTR